MEKPAADPAHAGPAAALVEMAKAFARSRVVCAAARLGVADALAKGARTTDELAVACGADAGALYRLLRTMAGIGLTAETAPGVFELKPMGEPLRKDWPGSAWPAVVFWSDLLADSWSHLTECVRTGESAARIAERQGIQLLWAKDPQSMAIFRAVMGTAPADHYMPIVEAWDFAGRRVVADLGGGGGALISAILQTHPGVSGMLVDRPPAVEAAAARFEAEGLAGRCKLIAADLAEEVPRGADVFCLKHVLHGCRDQAAIKILQNCKAAIPGDGCLLVIEFVLPDTVSAADPAIERRLMSDLNMLTATGGKERSAAEWAKLLHAGGFEMRRIIPLRGNAFSVEEASIIEAFPA